MTIRGSVFAPSELMSEKETMESIREGLKKSASAARELASACEDKQWSDVAETLDAFRQGIKHLADMRSMTRFETLMAASLKANPKEYLN